MITENIGLIKGETRVGKIRSVNGSQVFVALEPGDEVSPVIHGRTHRITQVGSILKVKIGASWAIGHVVSATATSLVQDTLKDNNRPFAWAIAPGEKALVLNLFGEIRSGRFERGITTFPDINSEVHVITLLDLNSIYSPENLAVPITFGELSGGINLPAILDLQKLIMRHGAVVGATGTGKSNAVSAILREIGRGNWPGSKVIIIDVHGEYSVWLKDSAKVISFGGDNSLTLPYWLVPFEELLAFFVGRQVVQEDLGIRNFKEAIVQAKIEWAKQNNLGGIVNSITVDSPVPYDLRKIWYDFYVEEYATYTDTNRDKIAWQDKGDPKTMALPKFTPAGAGNTPPFKRVGPASGAAGLLDKIRSRCLDRNYSFLFGVDGHELLKLDVVKLVSSWIEGRNFTILDLNGVPSDIVDITVGTISRLFFDLWRWGRDEKGVGRDRPIYMVFDEAHLYLSDSKYGFNTGSSIRTVTRVLREGRKYGLGALIVSQRPSDINETIFSQLGTIISLRLNNSGDIGFIKGVLADNLSNVSEVIPTLKTGEALISGEATPLPLRAKFWEVKDRDFSTDAKIVDTWNRKANTEGLEIAVQRWRSRGQ